MDGDDGRRPARPRGGILADHASRDGRHPHDHHHSSDQEWRRSRADRSGGLGGGDGAADADDADERGSDSSSGPMGSLTEGLASMTIAMRMNDGGYWRIVREKQEEEEEEESCDLLLDR